MPSLAETSGHRIAVSDERDLGAFIPSFLDDFGLNPYEFRVYCRLARRAGAGGQCWESINNIADKCKMNRKTVMQAIAKLLKYCFIRQTKRPGKSDLYQLTHHRHWIKTQEEKENLTSPSDGHPSAPVHEADNTSPSDGQHQSATGTPPVHEVDTKVFPQGSPSSSPQELEGEQQDHVATTQPSLEGMSAAATSDIDQEEKPADITPANVVEDINSPLVRSDIAADPRQLTDADVERLKKDAWDKVLSNAKGGSQKRKVYMSQFERSHC